MTIRANQRVPRGFKDPVQRELANRRREHLRTLQAKLLPQWLRTAAVALLWLAFTPLYAMTIAPYVALQLAESATVGLVVSTALLTHLWPTRTPQWRTLFWLYWLTSAVGSSLLLLNLGTLALSVTMIVGMAFMLLRVNQNGRKLVRLWRDWRTLR